MTDQTPEVDGIIDAIPVEEPETFPDFETKEQMEARLQSKQHKNPAWPGEKPGMVNAYICQKNPRHRFLIMLKDWGTTPFMLKCHKCEHMAQSQVYRLPMDMKNMSVLFEFYRPDSTEGLNSATKEHVQNGGLLDRRMEKPIPLSQATGVNFNMMQRVQPGQVAYIRHLLRQARAQAMLEKP